MNQNQNRVTAFFIAERYIGIKEIAGESSNPTIVAMLSLDNSWAINDDIPWCSAFTNYVAWLLRLPRSKSLAARSWLTVGQPIKLEQAEVGYDIVVLKQHGGPGPEVLKAPGHVGFYAGHNGNKVYVLGGNQSNTVSVAPFYIDNILGIRRLVETAPVRMESVAGRSIAVSKKSTVVKVLEKTEGKKTKSGFYTMLAGGFLELLVVLLPDIAQFIPQNAPVIIAGGGGGLFLFGLLIKYIKYLINKGR